MLVVLEVRRGCLAVSLLSFPVPKHAPQSLTDALRGRYAFSVVVGPYEGLLGTGGHLVGSGRGPHGTAEGLSIPLCVRNDSLQIDLYVACVFGPLQFSNFAVIFSIFCKY